MSAVVCTWCWIAPDGKQYPVAREDHCVVAEDICDERGIEYAKITSLSAEYRLEKLGYIKVTTGGMIHFDCAIEQVTQAQFDTLWEMNKVWNDRCFIGGFRHQYELLMHEKDVYDNGVGVVIEPELFL